MAVLLAFVVPQHQKTTCSGESRLTVKEEVDLAFETVHETLQIDRDERPAVVRSHTFRSGREPISSLSFSQIPDYHVQAKRPRRRPKPHS